MKPSFFIVFICAFWMNVSIASQTNESNSSLFLKFQKEKLGNLVVYKKDNALVSVEKINATADIASAKDLSLSLMKKDEGFSLEPLLLVKGFAYKYVNKVPCSAIVSYKDGSSYYIFRSCYISDESVQKKLYADGLKTLEENI